MLLYYFGHVYLPFVNVRERSITINSICCISIKLFMQQTTEGFFIRVYIHNAYRFYFISLLFKHFNIFAKFCKNLSLSLNAEKFAGFSFYRSLLDIWIGGKSRFSIIFTAGASKFFFVSRCHESLIKLVYFRKNFCI